METGNSRIFRVNQQSEDPGKRCDSALKASKGHLLEMLPHFFLKGGQAFLLRPSTDCVRPVCNTEGSLFYSKSVDSHINLILKNTFKETSRILFDFGLDKLTQKMNHHRSIPCQLSTHNYFLICHKS